MNTNIKVLSMEELENVSGGAITAKKVKKVVKEIAEDVGLAMLVTYAGYLAVKAGQLCYEAIRSR